MAIVNYLYLVLGDDIEGYVYFNEDFEIEMIMNVITDLTLDNSEYAFEWTHAQEEVDKYRRESISQNAKRMLLRA